MMISFIIGSLSKLNNDSKGHATCAFSNFIAFIYSSLNSSRVGAA